MVMVCFSSLSSMYSCVTFVKQSLHPTKYLCNLKNINNNRAAFLQFHTNINLRPYLPRPV